MVIIAIEVLQAHLSGRLFVVDAATIAEIERPAAGREGLFPDVAEGEDALVFVSLLVVVGQQTPFKFEGNG